jgi:hypothetical protein
MEAMECPQDLYSGVKIDSFRFSVFPLDGRVYYQTQGAIGGVQQHELSPHYFDISVAFPRLVLAEIRRYYDKLGLFASK